MAKNCLKSISTQWWIINYKSYRNFIAHYPEPGTGVSCTALYNTFNNLTLQRRKTNLIKINNKYSNNTS
ncbi:MAG: hypothetical protein MRQ12_00885 [Candidatus Midichloria mitochondrii]|nr:hypothetical protein [Candidatus Midichloria mitochondrii]